MPLPAIASATACAISSWNGRARKSSRTRASRPDSEHSFSRSATSGLADFVPLDLHPPAVTRAGGRAAEQDGLLAARIHAYAADFHPLPEAARHGRHHA